MKPTKLKGLLLGLFLLLFCNNYISAQNVTWNNSQTNVSPGETISVAVSYNAGAGNDMKYLIVKLEEMNVMGGVVKGYSSMVLASDADSNSGTVTQDYTLHGSAPESANLSPATNYYRLKIFMEYNSGQFANDNTAITITNAAPPPNPEVSVNFNTKHIVGGKDTFDRWKYISIHANQRESEWDGNNFVDNQGASNNASIDLRDHFLNGYDVYLGRDTGGITYNLNNVDEDPARAGFAKPTGTNSVATRGANNNATYANNTNWHNYENRNNLVLGGQLNPFWTVSGQVATGKGWFLANATATGEYMGRYVNEAYGNGGTDGEPTPAFVEVINEPAYHSHGGPHNFTNDIQDIAEFHKEAAVAIKAQAPNAKVGGYTTAFPNFEKGNFQRWNNRWKLFMDVAGDEMDFWSIHLYDIASKTDGKIDLRSGSNIEATLDMMEQYSYLTFGTVKPFVISEFGAQMNGHRDQDWSPYRDWLWIKSTNAQLMSLLERPNTIDLAIPFIVVKAIWGSTAQGNPYNNRLMRQENEPNSFVPGYGYSGKWVYTDIVKFYQLWSEVEGTRVDTRSDNLDIQMDAYVSGNKAYVIVNNLEFQNKTLNLEALGLGGLSVSAISKNHLYLENKAPVLDQENIPTDTKSIEIGAEATMILEYTFSGSLVPTETNTETKYFASTYLQPITANQPITFTINGVTTNAFGEAMLRLGVGRPHNNMVTPSAIKINNTSVSIPDNWRGYDQAERERFFGVLEVAVPYNLIQQNNTVEVTFPDSGGHISTASMQVFNFSSNVLSTEDVKKSTYKRQTLEVYPNPNDGFFSLASSTNIKTIDVYTVTGVKVKILQASKRMDISDLATGIYFLKADNGSVGKIYKK
ncbi:T9SS type A sorting domain-containing protein [Tamlana sp. 2_MG-2023]|uniref:T9SS type A sorting domain-containing protein n=1 Tax=unclassified Tamlana TaxID=2614803 RepID=UPI0026E146F5|nr:MULTISPECIES: T9SS type A sorting domain-containing protein [unclassified Tamlana]MDO6760298.1 T9SS type A sorting domain-containing protein [Tamlana sp. 2_MG-2023]MDO6790004.1 T9SS type A sorting domain-containing protein [Tamlana sp. 1_MG-2023]